MHFCIIDLISRRSYGKVAWENALDALDAANELTSIMRPCVIPVNTEFNDYTIIVSWKEDNLKET